MVFVSYPKSGRTRFVAQLVELDVHLSWTHDKSDIKLGVHRSEMTNSKDVYADKKVIFLTRDCRDVVVSSYFQLTKRLNISYQGTLSQFLRDDHYGIRKIVKFNMVWLEQRHVPKDFLHVSYENTSEVPVDTLKRILRFIGIKRATAEVSRAVRECAFERMQRKERDGKLSKKFGSLLTPGDKHDPDSFKVRKGTIGGFRDYFSAEDHAFCSKVFAEIDDPEVLNAVTAAGDAQLQRNSGAFNSQ